MRYKSWPFTCNSGTYGVFQRTYIPMLVKIAQTKRYISRKVKFAKSDKSDIDWVEDIFFSDPDEEYLELESTTLPTVALGRAFGHHLRRCGILDGYNQSVFVYETQLPHFLCNLTIVVTDGARQYKLRAEFSYKIRISDKVSKAMSIDKEKVSSWLYDCIVMNQGHDELFNMRMKYMLQLQSIRCFLDDLEIEL